MGTSMSFPKFSMSVSVLDFDFSVALNKKWAVPELSLLGLAWEALCPLGPGERTAEGLSVHRLV